MIGQPQPSSFDFGCGKRNQCGAEWLRCDLHMHSGYGRRSFTDLRVTRDRHAFQSAPEEDIRNLAVQFMNACSKADNGHGLDIVAITDHNTIEGFKILKPHLDAVQAERVRDGLKSLVVLPGVEITVGGERPVHLLVIFASDTDPDQIEKTIRYIFGTGSPFDPNTDQPKPTGVAISDFFKKLYEYTRPDTGERNMQFLVIPAHLTSSSGLNRETSLGDEPGLWNELRGYLRQSALTNKNWHGFQTSVPFQKLPQGLKQLLSSWIAAKEGKAWSELNKGQKKQILARAYWPLIEASDPQRIADIGSRFTWMKMGVPDLEGIRLALLDPESRLRPMDHGQPSSSHAYISHIEIKNTDLFDKIRIPFSPNLTTIIGGRGTGKSTLIEYLRYGLDRTKSVDFSEATRASETKSYVDSILTIKNSRDFGQTKGTLLENYSIEIDVVVSNHVYRITRSAAGIRTVLLHGDSSTYVESIDLRTLITPKVISQRQIAEIAGNPAALRNELDALVPANEFNSIRDEIQRTMDRLIELQNERRKLQLDNAKLPSLRTELRTIQDQIAIIESESSKKILEEFRDTTRKQKWLDATRKELDTVANELETLSESTELSEGWNLYFEAEISHQMPQNSANRWIQSVVKRIRLARENLENNLRENALILRSLDDDLKRETDEVWDPYYRSVQAAHKDLETELSARGTSPAFFEQLTQRRVGLERQITNLSTKKNRLVENNRELKSVRISLIELHKLRSKLRRDCAKSLRKMDADVRLKIRIFGDREDFESRWSQWLGGSGIRERDWKAISDYIFNSDEDIPNRISAVVEAIRADIQLTHETGGAIGNEDSSLANLIGTTLDGHFFRALVRSERIQLDQIERFLPNDLISGQVRSADGTFRAIETGSVGQRSTAILSLLLSTGGHPIILDQPEDDLDNQYVYKVVVDLLRRKKFLRQVVIATHNANIPVNGDAELIVALGVENQNGRVLGQGSIDDPKIKKDVSLIMEGSAEAFRRRRERYGF